MLASRRLATACAIAWVLLCFLANLALAQQTLPDPAFLQKALSAMQAQRNQAMDALAVSDAKAQMVAEDLAKANTRIKELEPKPEPKKEP
jgi:hypothetical protein